MLNEKLVNILTGLLSLTMLGILELNTFNVQLIEECGRGEAGVHLNNLFLFILLFLSCSFSILFFFFPFLSLPPIVSPFLLFDSLIPPG